MYILLNIVCAFCKTFEKKESRTSFENQNHTDFAVANKHMEIWFDFIAIYLFIINKK